ncbi:hypothetical protein [Mycolicibacterium sp. J2]|uniref:hypothetical protein n=1 Tax=Mycolicibacterium sp. J2 TaxID=2993511 RepID=UPI00224AA30F|nr:hypothetical protein [Mycolicibacterium sp. J2]MCX2712665.1 hypothetical protein [Mycolicibacterium sp. J2]
MTDVINGETTTPAPENVIDAELIPLDAPAEVKRPALALREVLGGQLAAGHNLSGELVTVATDTTAAVVEAPAKVIAAIREGATLPTAFGETGDAVQAAVGDAGTRLRHAVGEYVGQQATLPNAVVTGAAEVAASLIRAHGSLAASAVDGVFAVATVAGTGGDVRDAIDQEWSELNAAAVAARDAVQARVAAARQGIRDAIA